MSLKVFVVPVLLALFSQVISQNVIYISPSAESPCPVSACFTLAECAQNVTKCFVSNTTLRFLHGTHTLEAIVTVRDVTNLKLIGDSRSLPQDTTEIRFNGVAGLWFKTVSDVLIYALSFSNSDIFISEARLITISDCIFQYSRHIALSALNVTAYFKRVTFSNNHELGGMVAYDSTLIFSGGSTFANNSARVTDLGGGLSVSNCNVAFTGWSTFTNNTAHQSGGGFSAFHSKVIFTSTTTFSFNSARSGGGISSVNSTLIFSGITNFTLNKVVGFGGTFLALYNRVVLLSNTSFFRNSAGGFSCEGIIVNFTGVNKFINNSAMDKGGGIDAADSCLVFSGKNAFKQNTATFGGAISFVNVTASFHGKNKGTTFMNNSAYFGGGLAAGVCHLIFNGTTVFANNSVKEVGGGFFVNNSTGVFRGSNSFSGNLAIIEGGGAAIVASDLEFCGNTSFIDNSAGSFGGGFAAEDTHAVFRESSRFLNNSAGGGGGAAFPVGIKSPHFHRQH